MLSRAAAALTRNTLAMGAGLPSYTLTSSFAGGTGVGTTKWIFLIDVNQHPLLSCAVYVRARFASMVQCVGKEPNLRTRTAQHSMRSPTAATRIHTGTGRG